MLFVYHSTSSNVKSHYRYSDERGRYGDFDLTGPGISEGESGQPWHQYDPGTIGRCWSVPRTGRYADWIGHSLILDYKDIGSVLERLDALEQANMLIHTKNGRVPRLKRYLEASPGQVPSNNWTDIPPINSQAKERIGYPTQKPVALLDRIIRASSNEDEMVLDPFCGCATALVAADRLNRQWAGIDLSPLAARLVLKRLRDDRGPLFDDVIHREDVPRRTDLGELPNYRTYKHTLYGRQEGVCNGCRMLFPFRNHTVDHVIPQAKGGSDHLDNLQLLCGACNSTKGTNSQEQLIVRLVEQRIRQMTNPADPPTRPEIELTHPSYQPSKAEKEEPIEFPKGTAPDVLARALMQPARVRYVDPKQKR